MLYIALACLLCQIFTHLVTLATLVMYSQFSSTCFIWIFVNSRKKLWQERTVAFLSFWSPCIDNDLITSDFLKWTSFCSKSSFCLEDTSLFFKSDAGVIGSQRAGRYSAWLHFLVQLSQHIWTNWVALDVSAPQVSNGCRRMSSAFFWEDVVFHFFSGQRTSFVIVKQYCSALPPSLLHFPLSWT